MNRQVRGGARVWHVIAVLGAVAFVAAAVVGLGAIRRDAAGAKGTSKAGSRPAWVIGRSPHRPVLLDGARRVLFVGDSLTFGARDEIRVTFGARKVDTHFAGYPGTGLLSNDGFWLGLIDKEVRSWRPDVVVIEACCNYANNEPESAAPDGHLIAVDSEEMYAAWAAQAAEAVRRASADGAAVRWVVTPDPGPLVDPAVKARMARFATIYAGLGVGRVDWRAALQPKGVFTRTAVVDGRTVAIRQPDDLHITDAGDRLIAAQSWRTVAPILGLTI